MSTAPARSVGFGHALAFEWTKFASLRSTLWTTATVALVTVVGTVFVGLSGSLQPDDTVLGGSLTLTTGSLLAAGVLGTSAVCGEYSSGTIDSTLAAVPRRERVLAAKAVLLAGVLYVTGFVACALAYVVGGAILDDAYAQGEPLPALFGIAALFSVVGLLGLGIGTVLRHGAGAVAAVVGVVLLPALFAPLFGDLQRWIAGATPTAALQKLTQSSDATHETMGSLDAWPSLLLVAGYSGLLLLAAAGLLRGRDV